MKMLLKMFWIEAVAVILLLALGTIAYHNLEGWSYVDSFYFTGVTLTTVGYGDLTVTTTASKIFTVFFAFAGVAIFLMFIAIISQYYTSQQRRISKQTKAMIKKHMKKTERVRNRILKGSV